MTTCLSDTLVQANQSVHLLAYENQPIRDQLILINTPPSANQSTIAQRAITLLQMMSTCLLPLKVSQSPSSMLPKPYISQPCTLLRDTEPN